MKKTFEPGDVVEIRPTDPADAAWHGFRAMVTSNVDDWDCKDGPEMKPLSDRPDAEYISSPRALFVWSRDQVHLVKEGEK